MSKPVPKPIEPAELRTLALGVIAADRFPQLATIDGEQPRVRPVSPVRSDGFTIYVAIHNPRNGGGGGSVAGPVFSQLMGFTLHRYGVAPSGREGTVLPVTW